MFQNACRVDFWGFWTAGAVEEEGWEESVSDMIGVA
jgi:hypothetical protein